MDVKQFAKNITAEYKALHPDFDEKSDAYKGLIKMMSEIAAIAVSKRLDDDSE